MTSDTTTPKHADGATLVAVAEGDPEKQPDEAVLTHIFSCPDCAQNLRELRFGLQGLESGSEDMSGVSLPDLDSDLPLVEMAAAMNSPSETEARGKRMMIMMAIMGLAVVAGMFFLPQLFANWAK